uniref:NADH-ubiquinone oxidoreductase chain 1 n=2 Tax=Scoloplos TaxID=46604 RepID=Q19NV8_9ANNE|nr:NADH dehydrogenase subunit 1 [Scoloplos cf. armiger CB-2006]
MSIASLLATFLTYLMALLAMAFYTLMERKYLAYSQLRKGPNKVSLMGIPQPMADALKLFSKEQSIPFKANTLVFFASPLAALSLALILWSLYPHIFPTHFMPFSIIFFLCISSLNVYTILLAGWSSNSKYSLLGALRSIAQTISYEISMALILLCLICSTKTLTFNFSVLSMSSSPVFPLYPVALLWFITLLAETNRTPFDLSEGESELVSGFNIEYSSSSFALIFMAEYTNIIIMSVLTAALFIPFPPLSIPVSALILSSLFIWIRATLPRMRYDHLMYLTWKSFLPISIGILIMIIPITLTLN